MLCNIMSAYADCHVLFIITLNGNILSVGVLNFVMLSVVFLRIVEAFASAAPLGEAPDLTHKHYIRLERLGSNTAAYLVHL